MILNIFSLTLYINFLSSHMKLILLCFFVFKLKYLIISELNDVMLSVFCRVTENQ